MLSYKNDNYKLKFSTPHTYVFRWLQLEAHKFCYA